MMALVIPLGLVAFLWIGAAATGYGSAHANSKGGRAILLACCYLLAIAGLVMAAGVVFLVLTPMTTGAD